MSSRLPTYLISLLSLCVVASLYYAAIDTVSTLSPQGCRMSWMSPSYVLQSGFDRTWTPLAGRYSLWLYREVGWEGHELHGAPVLFIPGNAGSSHQVRSIASSATRQYYSTPYEVAYEFRGKPLRPLDFFAVEFNEDLSAFHGTTLDAQAQYTLRAIDYILSLYPEDTPIIIMGHSMGGIVGTQLLPHSRISTIITMSSPHVFPPARFDRRIDRIYSRHDEILATDVTPILSLCGGATDLMIPSESCILPTRAGSNGTQPYRRTIFSSALEGSWTGVGHREMVWCHQVRWRIARAALELGAATTAKERESILDTWLRDGHSISPAFQLHTNSLSIEEAEILPADTQLTLKNPTGSHTYVLPRPSPAVPGSHRFLLYVSQGGIPPTSPQNPLPLRASIYACYAGSTCNPLEPSVLKLVPSPQPGRPFPVPDEGSDESEGVVVFEAELPSNAMESIAVKVEYGDGRGWIVGGFLKSEPLRQESSASSPFYSRLSVEMSSPSLRAGVFFPYLIQNALVVYRAVPELSAQCSETLLRPLLQHTSHPSETHYFPLTPNSHILLHTHAAAPFVKSIYTRGLNLTIYGTGESGCSVARLTVTVDTWATIGRWGTRYAAPAASWAVGVVGILLYDAWRASDTLGITPNIWASLASFMRTRLSVLLGASFLVSFIPFPEDLWLGNKGEWLLAPIAPLMLVTVTGLVSVSWLLVTALMRPLTALLRRFSSRRAVTVSSGAMSGIASLALICLLITLLVPWQVGFLGCWMYHLFSCAAPSPYAPPDAVAVPLVPRKSEDEDEADFHHSSPPSPSLAVVHDPNASNQRQHLLLLMTWLLPLAAPVLAVWVRTLFTAGFTTPFDGDHNALYVVPFLILVDPSWSRSWIWTRQPGLKFTSAMSWFKPRWTLLILVLAAFVWGPRYTYVVFDAASVVLGCAMIFPLLGRRR